MGLNVQLTRRSAWLHNRKHWQTVRYDSLPLVATHALKVRYQISWVMLRDTTLDGGSIQATAKLVWKRKQFPTDSNGGSVNHIDKLRRLPTTANVPGDRAWRDVLPGGFTATNAATMLPTSPRSPCSANVSLSPRVNSALRYTAWKRSHTTSKLPGNRTNSSHRSTFEAAFSRFCKVLLLIYMLTLLIKILSIRTPHYCSHISILLCRIHTVHKSISVRHWFQRHAEVVPLDSVDAIYLFIYSSPRP